MRMLQNLGPHIERTWATLACVGTTSFAEAATRPLVVDVACYASRLVVEVDAPAHGASMRQDALRDAYQRRSGVRVLRFSSDEVLQRLDDVLTTILKGECSGED